MTIDEIYRLFKNSSGVCTDTRKITRDSIFFALKGANFNGNTFAKTALEQGAKYAVIDEPQEQSGQMILVDDVLTTLQQLARHHRDQLNTVFIGITGSNGKTTTKELIHAVLSSHFKTRATAGNLNNHIGVPLTLLSFTGEEEFGVIEMGANHVGEIAELCLISDPDFGIITNVGKAHLEGFGSFENIIKTKKGLYDHIAAKNGTIFLNSGNDILCDNKVQKKVFYGTGGTEYCSGHNIAAEPFVELDCSVKGEHMHITTNLIGAYNYENILAAVCIGAWFDVPLNKIALSLREYQPTNNRSEFRKTQLNSLILDAYNANPSSMEKAIDNFAEMAGNNKLAILGDMFELGEYSHDQHRFIVEHTISKKVPAIFVGKEFSKVKKEGAAFFDTVEELMNHFNTEKVQGKLLLIKGSRGIQLERLVPLL